MNTNYKSIILAISLLFASSASISAAPGDLDPTFGNGGIVISRGNNFNHLNDARAMAIQSDGKIVVVGEGSLGSFNWDFAVVRYNPDGSLDTSFGGSGIVITQLTGNYDGASSVAIQADGKIVVAGSRYDCFCIDSSFAVVRYNPDGSLDTSFNGTGIVTTSVAGFRNYAGPVAIQSDGRIVVLGASLNGSNNNVALVRHNADGSLDTSFNGTGKIITPNGNDGGHGLSLAIQADDKVVITRVSYNGSGYDSRISRYNTDGSPDSSFNGTGEVTTPALTVIALAIQSDGRIVVVGNNYDSSAGSKFAAARYNPNGSLDSSFGGTGKITVPLGVGARSVAIQADGKIVAAGTGGNDEGSGFGAARFNPNGSLDTTFNGTGEVITPLQRAFASAAAIQPDGKIVVAGSTDDQLYDFYDFVVVRYQGGGTTPTPTPTPTPTATPTPSATPTPTPTPAQTLRANGKIAFTSDRDGNLEIYVMNPDGSNQVRITSNNVTDACPTWSPDGRKIAFVSQKQDGSFAIFTMNADGAGRTEVTALNGKRLVEAYDSVLTRWRLLSWSPNGGRIAFHDYSDLSESIDIFVVNADGSGRQNLTVDHARFDGTPTWSPDGSKILFSRYDEYPPVGYFGTMLHAINVDGTNLTRLENGFADGWNEDTPDWSPAVNKIVYSVNRWDWVFDLYIANPDGTGRQFFHGCDWLDNSCKLDALTPAFSPDGTKIVFSILDFRTITPQKLYVKNLDGTGLMLLTDNGSSPSWQPLLSETCPNPIDCAVTFVRQHYRDFLNREPDPDGLAFWTNQIASCGADPQCIEVSRINDSGSFFLSIEFQETGYLVYRLYKAAYGDLPNTPVPIKLDEFLPDTQRIGQGVIVRQAGWEQVLENNKRSFALDFVQRSRFTTAYTPAMSATEFVDKLNLNAGNPLSQTERDHLVSDLSSGARSRADVLRAVAENPKLAQAEFNRAFVLMQYFGYLRRNPNDAPDGHFVGYNFWLNKLNQFNGNFIDAEMVKAFLSSIEYRQRFGP